MSTGPVHAAMSYDHALGWIGLFGGLGVAANPALPTWTAFLTGVVSVAAPVVVPIAVGAISAAIREYLASRSSRRAMRAAEEDALKQSLARLEAYLAVQKPLPPADARP